MLNAHVHLGSSVDAESILKSVLKQLCINHCVICWVFFFPSFCGDMPPKKEITPQKQGKSACD
jgi:hypothetical protein